VVRHILLLQPRPEATAEAIGECRTALTSLVGRIPGLKNCCWGANVGPPERREGFAYGFTMDFEDKRSLEAYGPHPEHEPVAARVRAVFERIVVFDFELS
jgi:hypothetical protein